MHGEKNYKWRLPSKHHRAWVEKLIEQRNNGVLYSSSAALCLITAFDNNPVLNSEFLDGGPVFFHLSEIKHGGGLCQSKQWQLPLSLAEQRQQRGRTLALGPANKPRCDAGSLQSQRKQLLHLSRGNNVEDVDTTLSVSYIHVFQKQPVLQALG